MIRLAALLALLAFPALSACAGTYSGGQVISAQSLGTTYDAYSYTAPPAIPGLALMGGATLTHAECVALAATLTR